MRLRYVAPSSAQYHSGNGYSGYTKIRRDIRLRPAHYLPDLNYIGSRQFGQAYPFAHGMIATAFRLFVDRVVFIRPEEQVCIVAARAIVAMVAYVEAIRDWAAHQFPCYAVGELEPTVSPTAPMASLQAASHPRPAGAWPTRSVNPCPEPLFVSRKVEFSKTANSTSVQFAHPRRHCLARAIWRDAKHREFVPHCCGKRNRS